MNNVIDFMVFLAHSKEDKPFVREIFYLLQLDGFSPWLDEENLVAGQNWELEIEKAVEHCQVVVVFISPSGVDRAGYLQKEISLAIDVAERQPEGSIYVIPVRIGESNMPRRLSHLHWLYAPNDPNAVADIYSRLQSSLLRRAKELGFITVDEDQRADMGDQIMFDKGVDVQRPLQAGMYLVRGHNPNGTVYYGVVEVKIIGKIQKKYEITYYIGGRISKYYGNVPKHQRDYFEMPDPITVQGEYKVTYVAQSRSGIYQGTWGEGGVEELFPASPFARFSNA